MNALEQARCAHFLALACLLQTPLLAATPDKHQHQPLAFLKPVAKLPKKLPESSGIIRSLKHPNLFWSHNDSGGKARIYGIDKNGTLLRTIKIKGAKNKDWEAIAMDSSGHIIIADTGNNLRDRKKLRLYKFAEPQAGVEELSKKPEKFTFTYPEKWKPQDAEALIAFGKYAYIFTKEARQIRIVRVNITTAFAGKKQIAQIVTTLKGVGLCTGADISADGRHLALLTYGLIQVYCLSPTDGASKELNLSQLAKRPRRKRPILVGQAEAIAFDGGDLVITTEQSKLLKSAGEIWRIKGAIPSFNSAKKKAR